MLQFDQDATIGQVVAGNLHQSGVTINVGARGLDPQQLTDQELAGELIRNGQLRERFRLYAALPTFGRAVVTLFLLWGSREPMRLSVEQSENHVAAVVMTLMCVLIPWLLFRSQVQDWREEQLAVLKVLKHRRAPLLIEKANRLLDSEPTLLQRLKRTFKRKI